MYSLVARMSAGPSVAVTSESTGFKLLSRLDLTPGLFSWLQAWLKCYIDLNRIDGIDEPEFTFLYVVLGTVLGEPNGIVDGVSVLEAGYGGDHLGPVDGVAVTGTDLLEALMTAFNGDR